MRHQRIKPIGVDTFMHVYNRTVGSSAEFPFGDVEKEEFIRRLKALDRYYAIDVLAVAVGRGPPPPCGLWRASSWQLAGRQGGQLHEGQ